MQTLATPERRIGRYVLLDELGRGAMGIVYRAQDPLINRTVAVKLLHIAHALSTEQARVVHERFMREAQTAGGLDHPNIVRIFDVGQDEESGQLYIVMEYIAGPSLEKVLEEQPLEPAAVLDLLRQVGSALDAAHARAIIHRDIKPANILFTEDGVPKITDFGIARISSSHLTQDVRDLGTPIYMSPEQVLGKPLDGRADLFSLGVLAYRLLTGRVPFAGTDSISVAYNVIHSTPSAVSELAPELPRAVDPVLERILEKETGGRYASGFEFHEALACAMEEGPAPAVTRSGGAAAPVRSGKRKLALLLGAAALALLGLLVLRSLGRGASAHGQAAPVERAEELQAAPVEQPVRPSPAPSVAPSPPPSRKSQPKLTTVPAKQERKAPPIPAPHAQEVAVAPAPPVESELQDLAPPAAVEPPPAPRAAPTATLSLSLGHWMARGNVTVWLDGDTILSQEFVKKKLVPFQTSSWGALTLPSGHHRLSAKVVGAKGKEYVAEPFELDLAPGSDQVLRIVFKDDALVFKRKD